MLLFVCFAAWAEGGGLISAKGLHESMNLDLCDVKTIISSISGGSFKCCFGTRLSRDAVFLQGNLVAYCARTSA